MEKWQIAIINAGKYKNGFENSKNEVIEEFCKLWQEILGDCILKHDYICKVQTASTVEFKVSDYTYLLGVNNKYSIEIISEHISRKKITVGCDYCDNKLYYYYDTNSRCKLQKRNSSTNSIDLSTINYREILTNSMNLLINLQEDKSEEWDKLVEICGGEYE